MLCARSFGSSSARHDYRCQFSWPHLLHCSDSCTYLYIYFFSDGSAGAPYAVPLFFSPSLPPPSKSSSKISNKPRWKIDMGGPPEPCLGIIRPPTIFFISSLLALLHYRQRFGSSIFFSFHLIYIYMKEEKHGTPAHSRHTYIHTYLHTYTHMHIDHTHTQDMYISYRFDRSIGLLDRHLGGLGWAGPSPHQSINQSINQYLPSSRG